MTPQERDLIIGLFQRLKPPPEGEIDDEARALIDRLGREQPLALYLLVQTALVQETALKGAQARIAELESKLADVSATGTAAEPQRRSFLSGLLGGGSLGGGTWSQPAATRPAYAPPPSAPPAAPQASGPWAAPAAASSGPSFLQSALTTAAGVAGGALLFQGVERLLGYGGSPFGHAGFFGGPGFGGGFGQPVEEVVVNNYETPSDQNLASGHAGDDPDFVNDDRGGSDPGQDVDDASDPGTDFGGGSGEGGSFDV
jgi:uncharacterized protein